MVIIGGGKMTQKDFIVKSIKFDREMEREIRVLAAKEGISFGEWVRKACAVIMKEVFQKGK